MKRILTGLVLLGIAFFVMVYGGFPLWCWISFATLISAYEMISMFKTKSIPVIPWLVYTVIAALLLTQLHPVTVEFWTSLPVRIAAIVLVFLYLVELSKKKLVITKSPLFNTARIILLLGGTFPFIYLLREGNLGPIVFALSFLMIWTIDIVALGVGKKFGKRPLNSVSPKKTVEGAIGGTIAGLIIAVIVAYYTEFSPIAFAGLGCLIAFLSQTGDLHESLIKRYCGVKDSSQILPGHGGMYDRADSCLFVAPIIFFLFN